MGQPAALQLKLSQFSTKMKIDLLWHTVWYNNCLSKLFPQLLQLIQWKIKWHSKNYVIYSPSTCFLHFPTLFTQGYSELLLPSSDILQLCSLLFKIFCYGVAPPWNSRQNMFQGWGLQEFLLMLSDARTATPEVPRAPTYDVSQESFSVWISMK